MTTRPSTKPRSAGPPDPSPHAFWQRRSTRLIGIALVVSLIAGITGVVYLTRGASDVTVDQAVERFRSQPQATTPIAADEPAQRAAPQTSAAPAGSRASAAAPAAPKAAPAMNAFPPGTPGVYVYATQGWEETDALSGQRHDYPKETSMTLRAGGCGWITKWQPLEERWEESEFCEHPQGTEMKRYSMYHQFFRRGVQEDFACPGGFVQKPKPVAGQSWTFSCKSDRSKATSKTTVVGIETMTVGGRPIKAVHMRYDITASGANRGKLVQERWLSESPRRMIRLIQTADLQTDSPFGPVGYKESFRLDLKTLDPRT